MHNLLSFVLIHLSYLTKTFLLVSSSVSSKQLLCSVHGQGQKREQKHATRDFVQFHNHSPLLTMLKCWKNSSEFKLWMKKRRKTAKKNSEEKSQLH